MLLFLLLYNLTIHGSWAKNIGLQISELHHFMNVIENGRTNYNWEL